jgi:endonuclease/exonuclease/phosphatase family metal-dependent hydrolase
VEALAPAELQVATFNIHHGVGLDGVLDLERTAGVISATGARVIALQELDRFVPRSGSVDQVTVLSDLTGLDISFHPTIELRGGEYGLALASSDPLTTEFVELPRVGEEEERGMILARGLGVTFIAAHLSHDRQALPIQTRALAELAAAQEGPTVVLGDFNQGAGKLGPLVAAGFHLGPRHRTMARRLRRRQLDHIAVGGGARLMGTWTFQTPASDHLPLVGALHV